MQCPNCKSENNRVTDSRNGSDYVRRRKKCLKCGYRFTTYERWDGNDENEECLYKGRKVKPPADLWVYKQGDR